MLYCIALYFIDVSILTFIFSSAEDVDPSVGKFRNMVQTSIVQVKVWYAIYSMLYCNSTGMGETPFSRKVFREKYDVCFGKYNWFRSYLNILNIFNFNTGRRRTGLSTYVDHEKVA